ncbi:MAG TPA: DNA alkylation repair protein, partial [Chloroflexi bacterium]|nr:DNA alkylation repair protein [Chloroflexota bacterium]
MNFDETMQALETMGTAQNRKIYARHGVGENMFGVSVANLKTLKKQIKKDHTLALQLWSSGNHDARYLATMIA